MAIVIRDGSKSYWMMGKRAVVRAAPIACFYKGFKGAEEPVAREK